MTVVCQCVSSAKAVLRIPPLASQSREGVIVGEMKDASKQFVYDHSYWSVDPRDTHYITQEQVRPSLLQSFPLNLHSDFYQPAHCVRRFVLWLLRLPVCECVCHSPLHMHEYIISFHCHSHHSVVPRPGFLIDHAWSGQGLLSRSRETVNNTWHNKW